MKANEIWILAIIIAALNIGGFGYYFLSILRLSLSILRIKDNFLWQAQKRINNFVPKILGFILVLISNIIIVFWGFMFLLNSSDFYAGSVSILLSLYLIFIFSLTVLAITVEIIFYLLVKPLVELKNEAINSVNIIPARNNIIKFFSRFVKG